MDILVFGECLHHLGVIAEGGHDAEFDLGIVGRQKEVFFVGRDKGFADLPSVLIANRDILQVGVVAAQPPGGRHRLVV